MSDEVIKIQAEDGKVLIGSDYIIGEDVSRTVFETPHLESFVGFLNIHANEKEKTVAIEKFQNGAMVCALDNEVIIEPKYHDNLIAKLKLNYHKSLISLRNMLGNEMQAGQLIAELKSLKAYADLKTVQLITDLQNLRISKIVNVEASNDNRGNHKFMFSSESNKKQDYIFPEKLTFDIPVFSGCDLKKKFEIDFIFSYSISELVSLKFVLMSYTFEDELDEFFTEKITKEFEAIENSDTLIGAIDIKREYDFDKIQFNGR